MKKLTKIALVASLACVATAVMASETYKPFSYCTNHSLADLSWEPVISIRSNPGAGITKDQFARHVSDFLYLFTKKTGYEACGLIAFNHQTESYGVELTTSKSHIGCVVQVAMVPDGYTSIGETIDSHPVDDDIRLSRQDSCLAISGLVDGNREHLREGSRFTGDTDGLGAADWASGTGWVEANGAIWFHNDGENSYEGTVDNIHPSH